MTATLPRISGVLTVADIEDRMIGLDDDLCRTRSEYATAAEEAKRASRKREVALAEAADQAPGSPTEKRWAALVAVGEQGLEAEARFARIKAEVEVTLSRVIAGAALLKSAKGQRDVGRYRDGP